MSINNMSNINLNLLKALDALLNEQHVSKAGERVGLTQSAMSVSLKQLRLIYKDELLVRGQQGKMILTPLAKSLIKPVKLALQHVESALTLPKVFDPKESCRTFHLGMSDYIAFVLLPKLMQKVATLAPNIKIVQHAINYLETAKPFEDESIDMALGQFNMPDSMKTTSLFADDGVIVADKNHPVFKKDKVSLKDFLKYPQVFVAIEGQPEKNFIVEYLEGKKHKVQVALMTPHTLIALQALPNTHLIANTVVRLAQPFLKQLGLAMVKAPYDLPSYQAKLYWHAKDQNDPAHKWLRGIIQEVVRTV